MGDIADWHMDTLYDREDEYDGGEYFEIKIFEIITETDLAWLISSEKYDETWFPKSKCEIEDGVLYVPEWLAIKKGLI